jgi:hypothetical protein
MNQSKPLCLHIHLREKSSESLEPFRWEVLDIITLHFHQGLLGFAEIDRWEMKNPGAIPMKQFTQMQAPTHEGSKPVEHYSQHFPNKWWS